MSRSHTNKRGQPHLLEKRNNFLNNPILLLEILKNTYHLDSIRETPIFLDFRVFD